MPTRLNNSSDRCSHTNVVKKLILRKATPTALGSSVYRIPYAEELNPAQLEAVMHTSGPALVLAGAGTGKTRTLVYRVARLVEDGIPPESILLLTFTRKSASEMLRRATALLDGRCERVAGGTFHSFAHSILRRFPFILQPQAETGASAFTVMDQADAEDAMNLVRGKFDVAALKKRFPQKHTLYTMYSTAVNTAQTLHDVILHQYPQFVEEETRIAAVIRAYGAYKHEHQLVDYDDLLLSLLALTKHEEIGPLLRSAYRFVMIDEYQDTNVLQHSIIKGLIGEEGNVMAVGDDAQSIYSFRGADVRNIHAFPDAYENTRLIRLEHNYRSTQQILNVCNAILRDAPMMFEKELFSERTDGDAPMLISCQNERQQSSFVVQQILELHEQGLPLREISVLFRSGFLSFDLEIELGKANIPFRKFGGMKFTEAAHVKDLLALLRITVNPRDGISWFRALLLLQGVGQKVAGSVMDQLLATLDPFNTSSLALTGKARTSVHELLSALKRAMEVTACGDRAAVLASWYKPLLERSYDDHAKRWKDIETTLSICGRYTSTESFLEDVALDPPQETLDSIAPDDKEDEFVTLSTIHSAKGLEWNSVFIIWVNEGRIPSARSAESEATLEEERRLLYVAGTRAKEHLYLTYPAVMFEWEHSDVLGKPSRFLEPVSEEMCPTYLLTEG